MKITATIRTPARPVDRDAIRARVDATCAAARALWARVRPRSGRRYRMRHEELLKSRLGDELRRAWWL